MPLLLTPLRHPWVRAVRLKPLVGLLLVGLVGSIAVGLWLPEPDGTATSGSAAHRPPREARSMARSVVPTDREDSMFPRSGLAEAPIFPMTLTADQQASDVRARTNAGTTTDRANAPSPSVSSSPGALSGGWSRRILRTATIEVEVGDVEHGVAKLVALIESIGGFVGSSDTQTDGKGAVRATLTAYVPAAEFARSLAGLDGLGRVLRRGVGGQDVSEEYVDLEARLRNLGRHEAQLLGFMGKAQKVPDLLSIESELSRVRGEIEQVTGRVRFLKARTELSTVQVALVRAPVVAPPEGQLARFVGQLRQALIDGWSAALASTLAVAVFTAQLSPLAIPAVVGWLMYRRRAGRRPAPAAVSPSA